MPLKSNYTCIKTGDKKLRLLFQCLNLEMNYPLYGSYEYSFLGIALFDFILSPITALMNAVVLFTIYKHKSLQTISNCIIFSLAFSDMITGLFTQPIKGIVMLNIFSCQPDCSFHVAALQLSYSLGIVSFLTLSLITLERYIAVFYPYKYEALTLRKSLVIRVIVGIWLLAALTTGLSFLTPQMLLQRTFAIAVIVVSLIFSISAHIRIVRVVNRIRRSVRDQQGAVRRINGENAPEEPATRGHIASKATKVAVSVLAAMALCYLPSGVFTALRFFGMANDFVRAFHDWTQSLVLMNSTINPLIYCLQMKDMRKKIYEVIKFNKDVSLAIRRQPIGFNTRDFLAQISQQTRNETQSDGIGPKNNDSNTRVDHNFNRA